MAKGWILTVCENVCFPAQDGRGHLQKHHKYLYVGVSKLGSTRSSKNYVIDKLNNSFTTCRHLVLPGKASFTGRKFSLFAHPHNETEIWNNPNLYNNLYLFARIIFILFCEPCVKISYLTLNTNVKSLNLFAMDWTFFTVFFSQKMLTLNFDSRFVWNITVTNFCQILKERIVLNQNCPGFPKMSKILI